jgi:hypothetical protein
MRTLRTRFTHSTSERRSPSDSAASSVETRSSPGLAQRAAAASPGCLGGQQRGDEVIAGIAAARGQQLVGVGVELDHGLLDELALGHQRLGVELLLDPVGPVVQARRVGQRRAHDRGDDQRRVGLGERLDELAATPVRDRIPELLQVCAHGRAPAIGRARGEGGIDEVAQAPVVVAVDAEDVAPQLLGQRPGLDAEDLGELAAGERGLLAAQEMLGGLAIEDDRAQRRGRQPAALGELGHPRMEGRAAQRRIGVVEDREVELGQRGHGEGTYRSPYADGRARPA